MMLSVKSVLLLVAIAIAWISLGEAKPRFLRHFMNDTAELCADYSDTEMCQAAAGRCHWPMKFHRKNSVDEDKREQGRQVFKTCLDSSNLGDQFNQFLDDNAKAHGKMFGGRHRGHSEEEASSEEYDSEDDDSIDMGPMGKRHEHSHGPHGKKYMIWKFINTLSSDVATQFRCCMLTAMGKFKDGVFVKEAMKGEYTEKIIVDPTVLNGYTSGIDSCDAPTDCKMMPFKKCLMKSCIDAVLQSLNP